MALLASLGLKPTPRLRKQAAVAQAAKDNERLASAIQSLMARASLIADAAARNEVLWQLKVAELERKNVEFSGDPALQSRRFKDLMKKLPGQVKALPGQAIKRLSPEGRAEAQQKKAAEKTAMADVASAAGKAQAKAGLIPKPAEAEKPAPDGKPKTESKTTPAGVYAAGRLGMGLAKETKTTTETEVGGKFERTVGFGGKAWVDVIEVPYKKPAQFDLRFTFAGEIKGGVGRDQAGANGAVKASVKLTGEIEVSIRRVVDTADMQAFRDYVKGSKEGRWPELRLARAVITGKTDLIDDLIAQVRAAGGSVGGLSQMKDGDETQGHLRVLAEAEADGQVKGIGFSLGVTVFGSLSRTVKRDGPNFVFTMTQARSKTVRGGGGLTVSGVGLFGGGSRNRHSTQQVVFMLPEDHPERESIAKQLLAVKTMATMLSLHGRFAGVESFVTDAKGERTVDNMGASPGPVTLNLAETSDFTEATTTDAQGGRTQVFSGSGSRPVALSVLGKPVARAEDSNQFVGGAGEDNQGFGQSTQTESEGDAFSTLANVAATALESPSAAIARFAPGEEAFLKTQVKVAGVMMDDASYERLARLSAGTEREWARFWRGDTRTYEDWMVLRTRLRAAAGDRQKMAKALAQYQSGASRGRHETLRGAIDGQVVPFEFPDALKKTREIFESLVVQDPLTRLPKDPAAALAKLKGMVQQLDGLRADIGARLGEFKRPDDALDMSERIDRRSIELKALIARREKAACGPTTGPTAGLAQANSDAERSVELKARIRALQASIRDARAAEQKIFAAWEQDNRGGKVLGFIPTAADQDKLNVHETAVRRLYAKWQSMIDELRALLQQAGAPYKAAQADDVMPDKARFTALWKANPMAGYRMTKDPGI